MVSLLLDLMVLVIALSLHLVLVLLRFFGGAVWSCLLKEPDSLSVDSEAVASRIFRVVLAVNNFQTHACENVLVPPSWSDIKILTEVVIALKLWSS